ncbi:MAG: FAD-dependent oxidoreductase [Turicibacter sp.]|nr:FAD-dependent oxidoreductase [Turicibacter sp.]
MRKLAKMLTLSLVLFMALGTLIACQNDDEEDVYVEGGNADELTTGESDDLLVDGDGTDDFEYRHTQADVIVVGGGMSGLTTAISAAQNGASVILIEKMPVLGGSTLFSNGIAAVGSRIQLAEAEAMTVDEFYENWLALQDDDPRGMTFRYPELIRPLVEQSGAAIDFLMALGFEGVVDLSGRTIVPISADGESGGSALIGFLEVAARDLGVEIHLETRGVTLIEEGGRISGIVADGPAGEVTYTANNAVILATGGFSRNDALMSRFMPELAPFIDFSLAADGHIGDGIIMAEEVGAVIHDEQWLIGLGLTNELTGTMFSIPGILVNHEGRRFIMETRPFETGFIDHYTYLFNYTAHYSPEGAFFIFDSSEAFQLRINQISENLDHPSAFSGDTLQDLAEAIGVPYGQLVVEVERNNALYLDTMLDPDDRTVVDPLGRTEGASGIFEGPFFALRMYPVDMGTIGGVIVNDDYQVLDASGAVIPGLFAVGEMSNGRYIGSMYFSGLSLMVALQQGIVAGQVAVQ